MHKTIVFQLRTVVSTWIGSLATFIFLPGRWNINALKRSQPEILTDIILVCSETLKK